jgi:Na+-translocating ferredoxin:NAD+ oxidoreductase subunit E
MSNIRYLTNGIIRENPLFVLILGCCPALAVTTSGINGLGMGIASTFVLICSNTLVSLLKNVIPNKVRIPAFIVIIATFVTIVDLVMQAFSPDLYKALGVFIPLIVVNCTILGRAEAFAQKNRVGLALLDGIGMGLGFTLALTIMGVCREILGNGSVFDYKFLSPDAKTLLIFIMPPGAFITYGYLIAIFNKIKTRLVTK